MKQVSIEREPVETISLTGNQQVAGPIGKQWLQTFKCQFWQVVLCGYVRDDQMTQTGQIQTAHKISGLGIVQVPVISTHPLFQPLGIGSLLQHGKVVIKFKQQGITVSIGSSYVRRHMAQISQHAYAVLARVEYILAGFPGIMRHGNRHYLEGPQSEGPVAVNQMNFWQLPCQPGLTSSRCQIDRLLELAGKSGDSMSMIRMLVSYQYCINIFRFKVQSCQPTTTFLDREPQINQQTYGLISNKRTIALAATAH